MPQEPVFLLPEKVKALQVISEEDIFLLQGISKSRIVKKADYVRTAGSVCRKIYFIQKGLIRTYYRKNDQEINLNFTFDGDFITDLKSLQTGTISEYVMQALEETLVWEIDKEQLLKLYNQSAGIMAFGRQLLENLLAEQEEHANLFKLYNPTERYQHVICRNPALLQRVSLTNLASYLGISRETLSRIRKTQV